MKNLQNNLHLEGTLETKNEIALQLNKEERIELAKYNDKMIKYLKENKMFLDNHSGDFINFGEDKNVVVLNNEEHKVETRKDITFVILNGEYLCPVYTNTIVCLNPLRYSNKNNLVYLSTWSVGGNVNYGKISEYIAGFNRLHSLEEIDIETFDAYEYFNINKKEIEMV